MRWRPSFVLNTTDGPMASGESISPDRGSRGGSAWPARSATSSSGPRARPSQRFVASGEERARTARCWATSQSVTVSALEATTRMGGPKGARASKRSSAAARRRSTPVRRSTRSPRRMRRSACVRRSWKAFARASSAARVASTSGDRGFRGGSEAHPPPTRKAPSRTRRPSLLLLGFRAVGTFGPACLLARVGDLLLDALRDRVLGIGLERALPGGDGVFRAAGLQESIAKVIEDSWVFLGEGDGALELAQGIGIAALLIVGPPEAVDEEPVLGVEIQRLLDELHGLRQVLAALGVHVADVVVGLGVLGIDDEGLDGVVVLLGAAVEEGELHAGVDGARVRGEDLLELALGLGVLARVHERGGEEIARPEIAGLELDGLAEGGGGALVLLLLVVDGPELDPHARVARRGIGERLD